MKLEFLKKRFWLPVILFVLIFLVLFFVWQGFFKKKEAPRPQVSSKIEIDFSLLKNPLIEALEPFEPIKALEEGIGRENPFLPY